jgi:hypothetical protein
MAFARWRDWPRPTHTGQLVFPLPTIRRADADSQTAAFTARMQQSRGHLLTINFHM